MVGGGGLCAKTTFPQADEQTCSHGETSIPTNTELEARLYNKATLKMV